MMRELVKSLVPVALIAVAPAAANAGIGKLNFDYTVNAGKAAVQVFDDGESTFVQVRKGQLVTQAFAVDPSGVRTPLALTAEAPYLSYPGIHSELELRTAQGVTRVKYIGVERGYTNTYFAASAAAQAPTLLNQRRDTPVERRQDDARVSQPPEQKSLYAQEDHQSARPLQSIPFARGSTSLGWHGRKAVRELAKVAKSTTGQVTIAIQYDSGKDVEQSRSRGRAIRAEFAKYNVTNIRYADGGEVSTSARVINMAVYVTGKPTFDEALARRPLEAKLASPDLHPSVEQSNRRPSAFAVRVNADVAPQINAAKADAEYEAEIRKLTDLLTSNILSGSEFDQAKKRLAEKRDAAKAQAEAMAREQEAAKAAALAAATAAKEQLLHDQAIAPAQDAPEWNHASSGPVITLARPSDSIVRVEKGTYEKTWKIDPDDKSVKSLLTKWANQAGWVIAWEYPAEVSINARSAALRGSFDQAINQVLGSLRNTESPLMATLYEANKTVRISAKD